MTDSEYAMEWHENVTCPRCQGHGHITGKLTGNSVPCLRCRGDGKVSYATFTRKATQ